MYGNKESMRTKNIDIFLKTWFIIVYAYDMDEFKTELKTFKFMREERLV